MAIAVLTGRKPATVRSWARKGLIERKGTDGRRRALYEVSQAQEVATHLDEILVSQHRPALIGSAGRIDHGQGDVQHSERTGRTLSADRSAVSR